jgi:hypothetical protein
MFRASKDDLIGDATPGTAPKRLSEFNLSAATTMTRSELIPSRPATVRGAGQSRSDVRTNRWRLSLTRGIAEFWPPVACSSDAADIDEESEALA